MTSAIRISAAAEPNGQLRDDPNWIAVSGGITSGKAQREFQAAKANAARVGLVFGSAGLRGHGVYATAPARITVTDFSIR